MYRKKQNIYIRPTSMNTNMNTSKTKTTKIKGKVWKNKSNQQKAVTIPKYCTIEEGDTVLIEKIEEK